LKVVLLAKAHDLFQIWTHNLPASVLNLHKFQRDIGSFGWRWADNWRWAWWLDL